MVNRVTAKEPKRSPGRGHLFIHRPICLFSLTQNEKSNNITESKRQNRTSQTITNNPTGSMRSQTDSYGFKYFHTAP